MMARMILMIVMTNDTHYKEDEGDQDYYDENSCDENNDASDDIVITNDNFSDSTVNNEDKDL